LYQKLFRTPRRSISLPSLPGHLRGAVGLTGEYVPHPFVLRLPGRRANDDVTLRPGDTLSLEMVLIEDAIEHLPSLAAAFESMGQDGLGRKTKQSDGHRSRGRVILRQATLDLGTLAIPVYDGRRWSLPTECTPALYGRASTFASRLREDPGNEVDTNRDHVQVSIWAPLRLKHGGMIVRPSDLTVDALASNVFRRITGLALCYGQIPAPEEGNQAGHDAIRRYLEAVQAGFVDLAEHTTLVHSDVEWTRDTRYSHRQKRRHPVGGLIGTIGLRGSPSVRTTWRRWLGIAERVHLGKKTSMGLGRISLVASGAR